MVTKCSGCSIRFDSHSVFSLLDSSMGKNVFIFEADMSPSVHIDNKGENILIIGKVRAQGLDNTTLTTGKKILLILNNQEKDLY